MWAPWQPCGSVHVSVHVSNNPPSVPAFWSTSPPVGGRLTVLRPAIVSEKATLSDGALTQEAEDRGVGGGGRVHSHKHADKHRNSSPPSDRITSQSHVTYIYALKVIRRSRG